MPFRLTQHFCVALLAAFLSIGAVFNSASASEPAAPESTVTPAQASRTLAILQDDKKRAELEQTLNAIAQATQTDAAATPAAQAKKDEVPAALAQNGLLAQLFAGIGQRLDSVMSWLRVSARTALSVGSVSQWWHNAVSTPEQREALLDATWKIAVILAAALLAEWLLRRALTRPRNQVLRSAANRRTAGRYENLLRRLPLALIYCVLKLLPLLAFLGASSVLLNALGGPPALFYETTLLLINAYATTRITLGIVQLMVSPDEQSLRLMPVSDTTATYLRTWSRRIVIVAVFGSAFAEIAADIGATHDVHTVLSQLVGLVVHVLLLIMVWGSRKETAAAIRGTPETRQSLLGLRTILADIWPFAATFLIVALWLLWSAGVEDGFRRLLHFFAWSAVVIIGATVVSIFIHGAIDRTFDKSRANAPSRAQQSPAAKGNYQRLVHRIVSVLIAVGAFIVLLQTWGVDTQSWFDDGSIGRRLASALTTIAITCILALAAWEGLNLTINRRLDYWTRTGENARATRLRTLVPILRTTLLIVIAMIVLLTALSQLGVNIAPLIAGASIIGVALGFGSQKLVQDFITGIFLLMENAMQVGDSVTVAGVSGTVEYLSIRTVRLRAGDGSLHVVPFSSVSTVTNSNRGIGNASVRVSVRADSDIDKVFAAIKAVGAEMRQDPKLKDLILADLDIWGVDQVDGSMITIAGQIRTVDRGRMPVQRSFNLRILERFREQGIQFVNPLETRMVAEPANAKSEL